MDSSAPSSRLPTCLPRLALPLLRPPSRCSLRADGRHPYHRLRTLPRPPEPGGRPPAWLGQPLRCFEQRTNRRRKATELALSAPPWRRKPGRSPDLRRGRLGVVPLRRGGEPGARILLPPLKALRGPTDKQTLGWTTPRVRHPEQADRWTWLVLVAYAQLRLAPRSLT